MESAILSAVKIHGLNPAKEISLKEVIETILINRALFVSMFRQRSQCRYVFLGFFVSHLADVVQKNLYGII